MSSRLPGNLHTLYLEYGLKLERPLQSRASKLPSFVLKLHANGTATSSVCLYSLLLSTSLLFLVEGMLVGDACTMETDKINNNEMCFSLQEVCGWSKGEWRSFNTTHTHTMSFRSIVLCSDYCFLCVTLVIFKVNSESEISKAVM